MNFKLELDQQLIVEKYFWKCFEITLYVFIYDP